MHAQYADGFRRGPGRRGGDVGAKRTVVGEEGGGDDGREREFGRGERRDLWGWSSKGRIKGKRERTRERERVTRMGCHCRERKVCGVGRRKGACVASLSRTCVIETTIKYERSNNERT